MATHVSTEFVDSGTGDFLDLAPTRRGYQQLSELVRKKKAQTATDQARFDSRKRHWLRLLDKLYQEVEKNWLASLIASGDVVVTRTLMMVNEEYIGTYQAPALELQIGDAFARLNPKGTLVIGASGRVDMEGPSGKVILILDSEEGAEKRFEDRSFTWKIVNRAPKVTAFKLDLDTFSDALIQIISV